MNGNSESLFQPENYPHASTSGLQRNGFRFIYSEQHFATEYSEGVAVEPLFKYEPG